MSTLAPIYFLQRALSVSQAIPVVGIVPGLIKAALSVAELVAGVALTIFGMPLAACEFKLGYWMFKEGGSHLELGLKALLYSGVNVVTLGFSGLIVETLCLTCPKC